MALLSQFAAEKEVLFPPLMALEVLSSGVENRLMVVDARLSLNMMSQTLEQARALITLLLFEHAQGQCRAQRRRRWLQQIPWWPKLTCCYRFGRQRFHENWQKIDNKVLRVH